MAFHPILSGHLLGLFFHPEDGGIAFFKSGGKILDNILIAYFS
jgi:hypothetical protein